VLLRVKDKKKLARHNNNRNEMRIKRGSENSKKLLSDFANNKRLEKRRRRIIKIKRKS